MNFRKTIQEQDEGMQLAPMIDILFLLLIFFMVASVFAQWETKLDITVPTSDTSTDTTRTQVELIINLDQEGRIFVNNTEFSPDRLQQLLIQIAELEGQPVIIRADAETEHKHVIGILDICRKVDIWNVSFATLPPEGDGQEP